MAQLTPEARAAKREYMRTYRQSETGRAAIAAAQNRYWERRFAEMTRQQPQEGKKK